jgi:hypothetical protein
VTASPVPSRRPRPERVDDLHGKHVPQTGANGSPVGSGKLANTVTVIRQVPDVSSSLTIPIEQTPALTLVKSATPMSYSQVGRSPTRTW